MTSTADPAAFLAELKRAFPKKFARPEHIFRHIRRGDRIFIGTGCGEPQYLVQALSKYVESYPTAIFDAEVCQVWTLGVAPYTEARFDRNFRHNSFFIGPSTRDVVNQGLADYTPIFLSQVPDLFRRRLIPIDVALVQTSLPDETGRLSLGISVDITRAAVASARLVIAQVNAAMPWVAGDGLITADEINFFIPHDEPLLEYHDEAEHEVARQIGRYVARLVQDGETIQVGYGAIPDAVLAGLAGKKSLGVHTELLSAGLVTLMQSGVVDNSRKSLDPGKTVAAFCMGTAAAYAYLAGNPAVELRGVDYTNNPLVIAGQERMVAINSALEIDLTGQATAESLGPLFYSGIGGQADFMRGAALATHGKTILALPATAAGGEVSRIVPYLREGAGVTLNRGDVHYVVTEYGIAYVHGKNLRERAMELIAIAAPAFRPWLIEEARQRHLIYADQVYLPGQYPEELESYRTSKTGLELLIRPVKISDEPLLKAFFYSLSEDSLYYRFMSTRKDMPHERLQQFIAIDYTKDMVLLAVLQREEQEIVVGLGQYSLDEAAHMAEVSFAVADTYQNSGVGTVLLEALTYLAQKRGLFGFTAEVLPGNTSMLHVFEKMEFDLHKKYLAGVYELTMLFRGGSAT